MLRMTDKPTRLLLARHGESQMNREGRFYGRIDCDLTDTGEAQAASLADHLKTQHIDLCYSSPALRARRTAEYLVAHHGLALTLDERLWEQHFGEWEGKRFDEVIGEHGKNWRAWLMEQAMAPPGGETLDQVGERARAFVADVQASHPGKTLLVVAHAGVIQAVLNVTLGLPMRGFWAFRAQPGSLTDLHLYPEGPVLMGLNSHLCPEQP